MAEATWAKVLQAVYEDEDVGRSGTLQRVDGLTDQELEQGLSFLSRHGLIVGPEEPVLTEKGFDVARQREMQRSGFEMNLFLAAFTFVLSFAIVLQAVFQLRALGLPGYVAGGGLVTLTFVFLLLLERRTHVIRILLDGR